MNQTFKIQYVSSTNNFCQFAACRLHFFEITSYFCVTIICRSSSRADPNFNFKIRKRKKSSYRKYLSWFVNLPGRSGRGKNGGKHCPLTGSKAGSSSPEFRGDPRPPVPLAPGGLDMAWDGDLSEIWQDFSDCGILLFLLW